MKGVTKLPKASGIYILRHDASGREYVGQAVDIKKRVGEHVSDLNRGKHHSPYLQNVWNKYGPRAFSVRVAELVEPVKDALNPAEQRYLDTDGFVFNACRVASSTLGYKFTEGQREAKKAQWEDPAQRERLSAQAKAVWEDPAYRERMKAISEDPAHRERQSAALKAVCADPAERERRSARMKALYEDPAQREKAGRHSSTLWAEVRALGFKTLTGPKVLKATGDRAQAEKADAEEHARQAEARRAESGSAARNRTPKRREQQRQHASALWDEVRALGFRTLVGPKVLKATGDRKAAEKADAEAHARRGRKQFVKVREQNVND